jgi:Cof subfamily protein (haloacid dehalogenase superfamily)
LTLLSASTTRFCTDIPQAIKPSSEYPRSAYFHDEYILAQLKTISNGVRRLCTCAPLPIFFFLCYNEFMIRLIATDLDDTLLRSDLSISFYTRRVIQKALRRGIPVVLASGRTPSAMQLFVRKLNLNKVDGYCICENGALVQNIRTGEFLKRDIIPYKTALTVYRLADAEGFSIQKYEGDITYISRRNEFTDYDKKLTGLEQIFVEDFSKKIEDGCTKLLIPGDPMILGPLQNLMKTILGDEATIFTSKPYFLEIMPPGVDKGSALAWIANKLDIKREEVMAFGDSMNDEGMLRWAGVSVAMKNGNEQIRQLAHIVTEKTNNDDGVASTIEQYIFKENH